MKNFNFPQESVMNAINAGYGFKNAIETKEGNVYAIFASPSNDIIVIKNKALSLFGQKIASEVKIEPVRMFNQEERKEELSKLTRLKEHLASKRNELAM